MTRRSPYDDMSDADIAPVMRAHLWLILEYMRQMAAEIEWRRLYDPREDTQANRCPSVNLCHMECEIALTRMEYIGNRTPEQLDMEANVIIGRMNADTGNGEHNGKGQEAR